MTTNLYLDTARFGLMSPSARNACRDAMELATSNPKLICCRRFLENGVSQWPDSLLESNPGLQNWQGVKQFKQSIQDVAGGQHGVAISSRSSELMKLAATMLFQFSRNVLVTDLCWPGYASILERERLRTHNTITRENVRELVFSQDCTTEQLVSHLVRVYRDNRCDGLFLPAVSSDGIRLPVDELVARLEAEKRIRFSVVDGAQEFGQLPTSLPTQYCDFYITGGHKWVGAHLPIGIGLFCKNRTRDVIETSLERMLRTNAIEDPLLRLLQAVEAAQEVPYGESVNLLPLFACSGAIADQSQGSGNDCNTQSHNVLAIESAANDSDWRLQLPSPEFRTGIVLLHSRSTAVQQLSPTNIEGMFAERGVSLTAYDQGYIRVSIPQTPLALDQISAFESAVKHESSTV